MSFMASDCTVSCHWARAGGAQERAGLPAGSLQGGGDVDAKGESTEHREAASWAWAWREEDCAPPYSAWPRPTPWPGSSPAFYLIQVKDEATVSHCFHPVFSP